MDKIDIAGLKVDLTTRPVFINKLLERIKNHQTTWVTTVYSEFLFGSLKNPQVMNLLNKADIALPDGIGMFWANKFLSIPLTAKSYLGKILQAFWQVKYSLFFSLLNRSYCSIPIPSQEEEYAERIPGSELIWDLAGFASDNKFKIYLLGGFGHTAEKVAKALISKYPNILISGHSSKNPDDISVIEDIQKCGPDFLFVAYGPIRQEKWIYENLPKLPSVKLAIGMGGAFDYIAGEKIQPPSIIRKMGLEWLFRLLTQPHRLKRIFNATFGLASLLAHYKVFMNYPLRDNVAIAIVKPGGQILVFQRKQRVPRIDLISDTDPEKYKNYWQLPQGGIDAGEDLIQAARREAWEETGLTNLGYISTSAGINIYLWNNALRNFRYNKNFAYRGQKQRIVYFKYIGSDDQIKFDNLPEKEFVNYKWINFDDLTKIVHSERHGLVKIVLSDLKKMSEKGII